jgi:hypothetical protein
MRGHLWLEDGGKGRWSTSPLQGGKGADEKIISTGVSRVELSTSLFVQPGTEVSMHRTPGDSDFSRPPELDELEHSFANQFVDISGVTSNHFGNL